MTSASIKFRQKRTTLSRDLVVQDNSMNGFTFFVNNMYVPGHLLFKILVELKVVSKIADFEILKNS